MYVDHASNARELIDVSIESNNPRISAKLLLFFLVLNIVCCLQNRFDANLIYANIKSLCIFCIALATCCFCVFCLNFSFFHFYIILFFYNIQCLHHWWQPLSDVHMKFVYRFIRKSIDVGTSSEAVAVQMCRSVIANTIEMVQPLGGRHLPSPMAYGILCLVEHGSMSSKIHSSTEKHNNKTIAISIFPQIVKVFAWIHWIWWRIYLQTCHVCTEKWCKFATASRSLTLITHLIVKYVWFDFDALINVAVLQLHKSRRYGCYVALLIGKRYPAGTLFYKTKIDFRISHFFPTNNFIKCVENHTFGYLSSGSVSIPA